MPYLPSAARVPRWFLRLWPDTKIDTGPIKVETWSIIDISLHHWLRTLSSRNVKRIKTNIRRILPWCTAKFSNWHWQSCKTITRRIHIWTCNICCMYFVISVFLIWTTCICGSFTSSYLLYSSLFLAKNYWLGYIKK